MYSTHDSFYENLTVCAKLGLMLISSERVLPYLSHSNAKKGQYIYEWFFRAIGEAWQWTNKDIVIAEEYYTKYSKSEKNFYIGYYTQREEPKKNAAFNTCLNTFLYTVRVMSIFDSKKPNPVFNEPTEVAQTDSLITVECLEWAVKASDDEQAELAWQEKVINQLLKDHYTEEFDALGELIGREYFEPFL